MGAVGALILLLVLAGCHKEEKAASQAIRPVRTVTVEFRKSGDTLSLTGEVQPRYQADIGFRIDGKILARPVDVGTTIKKGDLLARLDPQRYRQDAEIAKSDLAAAEAEVTRSQGQEYRKRELYQKGHATQVEFDIATRAYKTAQAKQSAARARLLQATTI